MTTNTIEARAARAAKKWFADTQAVINENQASPNAAIMKSFNESAQASLDDATKRLAAIITAEMAGTNDSVTTVFAKLAERFPDHPYRQVTIMDGQGGNCAQIITQRSIHSSRSNVWQGVTLAAALDAAMKEI